ncbi:MULTISPECIES: CopD family protein [Sphingomonadales]|uniref:CopD family protein n=1 Tax=Sphingomonadales TaxID=204457 RepID=UPI000B31C914|nr:MULTISPECIES: CopD family protein [Sphingomonadales]
MAHRSLDSFSRVGTICVAVIVITGMINGQILVGLSNISSVFESTYGQLLVLKLVLVGAMLFLGAKNRWRLTPDLGMVLPEGNTATAVAALRTSLLLEAGAGLAILGLIAWLGMLEPPASMTMP